MKKKYIVVLTAEIALSAIEEITSYINNGWYMVDFTPLRIVLEKQEEVETLPITLKKFANSTNGLVSAIYDEDTNLVYGDEEGWVE